MNFEPEGQYRVRLKRAVPFGGIVLRPNQDVVLKGKVAAELVADIVSAEKIG